MDDFGHFLTSISAEVAKVGSGVSPMCSFYEDLRLWVVVIDGFHVKNQNHGLEKLLVDTFLSF